MVRSSLLAAALSLALQSGCQGSDVPLQANAASVGH
jgi:hypothetical protein